MFLNSRDGTVWMWRGCRRVGEGSRLTEAANRHYSILNTINRRLFQNSVAAEVTRLKLYGFLRIWSLPTSLRIKCYARQASAATVLKEAHRCFFNLFLKLSVFQITLLLVIMADVKVCADPLTNKLQSSVIIKAPHASPPTMFPQVSTNLQTTNFDGGVTTSNGAPRDPYETWLLKTIDDTKRELQQTNLPATYRRTLEWLLREHQGNLSDHQAQVQKKAEFIKSVRANPRTAWTNRSDPIEQAFASDVAKYERMLADPALAPNLRETYEAMLEGYKQDLADHKTNAQLWADLRMARQLKDHERIDLSEKQLADYLAIKLGKIQGKKYSPGMSLDAVLEQYRIQAGGGIDRRQVIRAILVFVMIAPLVFFTIYKFWRRKA